MRLAVPWPEGISGQSYMAILVARLVGLHMGQSKSGDWIWQRFTIVFHYHHLPGTNKVGTRPAPILALER